MSSYTKSTNFTAKDSLSSGDPNKVVKGAEIDTEFNNIQTAVNSKLNSSRFPNVSGNVGASNTELDILDGATLSTSELNLLDGVTATTAEINVLDDFISEQRVELGNDFDAGEEVVCVRTGNVVTITADGPLSHSSGSTINSTTGAIPSAFRPSNTGIFVTSFSGSTLERLNVASDGTLRVRHSNTSDGSGTSETIAQPFTVSYVITGNVS